MKSRRGTEILASNFAKQVTVFAPGDIVTSVLTGSVDFIGEVLAVDERLKKISVNWGDGSATQHDPDEIQHLPYLLVERMEAAEKRTATRRSAMDTNIPSGDQFVGDPKVHGIDKPRGGGFSIMQNLQKDLAPEAVEQAEEGPKIDVVQASELRSRRGKIAAITKNVLTTWNDDGSITESRDTNWDADDAAEVWTGREASDDAPRSRRAMYWTDKGRVYRLTKGEQNCGVAGCPRCKGEMAKEQFTRNDKLYVCQGCGFKVPASATVTQRKVEVEVEPDGAVEIEIEASRRGSRVSAEVLAV